MASGGRFHDTALGGDVPGWAEGGMPVMGGRQRLLAEGGNGGIRSGPASEETGVEGLQEGGNGGIRSGPGSEEMEGGEMSPMRFVRGGGGEVGGYPSAAPLEEEEVLGGSEGWRMDEAMLNRGMEYGEMEMGRPEMGRTEVGRTEMEGMEMGRPEMGGMENGVGLPTWGDYYGGDYYGWGK